MVFVFLAALIAGLINSLAGGGTLITFPALISIGFSAISANITNTVALCPGYLGGTLAQVKDLKGQKRRIWSSLPAGILGGLLGGLLLILTGDKLFTEIVPFLILIATGLLGLQNHLRKWVTRHINPNDHEGKSIFVFFGIFLASIYGGYFGAGLSVIVLAVLGLILNDNLTRLNALKQGIAFVTNITAAIFFLFSGRVDWIYALTMAIGALIGGAMGGHVAGKIRPSTLRGLVVGIGLIVGFYYLARNYLFG